MDLILDRHPAPPPPHTFDHPYRLLMQARAYEDAHGGLLPDTAPFRYLEYRHDADPAGFDRRHKAFAPLLERDAAARAVLGLIPVEPKTAYLEYRRGLNPARFDRYHPAEGRYLSTLGPIAYLPATHSSAVPAPAGVVLLAMGLAIVLAWTTRARACSKTTVQVDKWAEQTT